ncbi:MAG TPA: TlpA disulfide reductase family protein [Gemmatimonadales bacterium]|jgi:cytochrome c biogenesis protein CcmG/thiol:disulfide interchange protein DsbE|nr:TlpA disulfide reductase family protein [Gemmatimonadales bacterium]
MHWRRWLVPLSALPVLALLAWGLTRDAHTIPSPLPGKAAPDFALQTLSGDSLHLHDLTGQPVLVNFWASWCLACRGEHQVLVDAAQRYGPKGLRVVGVVYEDTRDNAQQWITERGGTWPNVLDIGSHTAIQYGLFGVPETFFIARDGRIVYKQIGPLDPAVIDQWVPKLLASSAAIGPNVPEQPFAQGKSEGYVRTSPDFPATRGTTPPR